MLNNLRRTIILRRASDRRGHKQVRYALPLGWLVEKPVQRREKLILRLPALIRCAPAHLRPLPASDRILPPPNQLLRRLPDKIISESPNIRTSKRRLKQEKRNFRSKTRFASLTTLVSVRFKKTRILFIRSFRFISYFTKAGSTPDIKLWISPFFGASENRKLSIR
jgi:hypothetical protein